MNDQQHQDEHNRQCDEVMNHRRAYRDMPPLRVVRPDYRERPRKALWRHALRSPLLWECLCVFFLTVAIMWELGAR